MTNRLMQFIAGAALVAGSTIASTGAVTAADDQEYGAYIYSGTCDTFASDADADVGDLDAGDDHAWTVLGRSGEPAPDTIYAEDDEIGHSIEDLTQVPFVVVVRADDTELAPVIACGRIEGEITADVTLLIDLHEVDASGFEGRAYFAPANDPDLDEPTEVTVGIWAVQGTMTASPEASPTA